MGIHSEQWGYCGRMEKTAHRGFDPDLADWLLSLLPPSSRRMSVLGISGLQGSGKSTLAAQVVDAAIRQGRRAATLSLDDVYLTAAQRHRLADTIHPLLATRGPAGTHDLPLLHRVIDDLADGRSTALPRFDKLTDDRLPSSCWPVVEGPLDLLVLEGWMLGARPQPASALGLPVNRLEIREDAQGIWRQWCNRQLADRYPAIWQRLDRLVFLQPPDWDVVLRWRSEQEAGLALRDGRKGMDRDALARFVAHFERTSRQMLHDLPAIADAVVRLDDRRGILSRHAGPGR